MEQAPPWDPVWVAHMLASYRRQLGRELAVPDGARSAEHWLYAAAPFCVLAHDGAADPRFVYANLRAQRCFEYSWQELVGLPSRLSALPDARAERARLLADVAQRGYAQGYRGLRVSKSGRKFWIEDVTVWNVHDAAGQRLGQAATYQQVTPA